jgi:CxxC motif-containing protein
MARSASARVPFSLGPALRGYFPWGVGDPKTYITTVGLYNTNKELLATAKTSKPIQKSFTKEILLKIKLDF